ncbi:Ths1p [Rhizoctonia solani AG-1 IA]|uniref:threonine--tRNA ligase n=1 Tax=Thanatephorus cucumeris (strain AG1-IA) TaxID=983506 RepID=L8WPD2_THACA|nr:Ths1p [Rhizoctonia solani AG-1 IA]
MRFRLNQLLSIRPPPNRLVPLRYPSRPLRLYSVMSAEAPHPVPHPVHSTAQPAQPAPGPNTKKEKKAKATDSEPKAPLELNPPPEFFDHRIQIYDKLKKEYDEFVSAQPREPITITLPDGSTKEGKSWETSPMSIAAQLSKSLSERVVIAKVDGNLWDLERPLEKSCSLELLDFEHPEGKRVFWHSSAHVLGEAAEKHYGCHLCVGPPTDDGFFYEMAIQERAVSSGDYSSLETLAKNAVKEKQRFERLVVPKETLLEMFKYNKYKTQLIQSKIPDGTSTTVYRCGPMIDLCVGPHVPHTGRIKAFMVTKNSSSYFLGDAANDSLQRIYGISFPDTKQLTEYKAFLAEAAKRDHRRIGKLGYDFHDRITHLLRRRNIGNADTKKASMALDDMFTLPVENESFALKPMNCPGHALIFDSRDRYVEVPDERCADRIDPCPSLRSRRYARVLYAFSSAIFNYRIIPTHADNSARFLQIEQEIEAIFEFFKRVYGIFGFTFKMELSTRPEKYLGNIETWNTAEKQLQAVLDRVQPGNWELNPGDGAFYGPKIDITIQDALKRSYQCATIQLDFQIPERFNLKYRGPEGGDDLARPVMIHRAILGSLERFIAIVTEHFAGKWPFWLSPRQVMVVPVAVPFVSFHSLLNKWAELNDVGSRFQKDYASEVQQKLWDAGMFADIDLTGDTLPKKIRNAEIAQYNFIVVVGEAEANVKAVNVRNRDDVGNKQRQDEVIPLDDFVAKLLSLKTERRLENKLL